VGVLEEEQKKFAEADETSVESFSNIFDKGHRCTLAARKQGRIVCSQSLQKSTNSSGVIKPCIVPALR
jgi:hypothetical protein